MREWTWRVLEDELSSRLGPAEWAALLERSGGNESRPRIDRLLANLHATADDEILHELGHRVARAWGAYYEAVVDQFRHHPGRLVELVAREVYPGLVAEPAPRLLRSTDGEVLLRFDDALPAAFHQGLAQGWVELCGVEASARPVAERDLLVQWRAGAGTTRVRAWDVAASAVRFPFLVATIVPVFVALAVAAQDAPLDLAGGLLTLVGVLAFQVGSNALNDYYDRRAGDADGLSRSAREAPLAWLRASALAYYALGSVVGLVLVARSGIEVLWLGIAGLLLGVLYTAPPVRLAYRGLGELAVAVGFGPLIVLGTYFVQRHAWSLEALLASVPLAFLIALVLYLHELPDRAGDARLGKRTLIVRLPEQPAIVVYVLLQGLTYLLILGGVALAGVPAYARYAFPAWSLLGLATLPLAVRATVLLARNYRYPYRLVPTNAFAVRLHLMTAVLFAVGYAIPHLP